ncbi:reverse transcriptase domain-containing protein [Tanacetum coccineum]
MKDLKVSLTPEVVLPSQTKAVNHDVEKLLDRPITNTIGIAEDVFVNVGKFQFPADFVVVDFEPDPRVPLILGRCFLKTSHALIDVYEGEITLRVGKEAITFNLDQTSKYTADYDHMTANKIDVIDMACDEYSQEVLGFSNVIASGNPTPYFEPIVSTASPNLTPFGDSDFLLFEEADSFLALEDDPTSSEVDPTYQDPEGDILLLEAILNSEPPPPLPNHEQYMPGGRKELKLCEAKTVESSVDEPPEVELKELPPHLEYAFLEGDDKLPVIIAKDLKDEEKAALLKVLKSHKRAIAWKLSDIKGVSPEFCTHKILMEEDYEPSVQSQRRVNPKIHDVIKKEVEKLLDAGLIYPISDSPWVSPVHCVPKKGGMTVITNDENELIPTRLVTGWRVCIDYRKLNEATRKDHFPLPFMDQMLERLAGNEYYCFLDGFSTVLSDPIIQRSRKDNIHMPYTELLLIVACILEKELLACVISLPKKKDAKAKIMRLDLIVQEFDIEFETKKRADESRRPINLFLRLEIRSDQLEEQESMMHFLSKSLVLLLFKILVPHGLLILQIYLRGEICYQGNDSQQKKKISSRMSSIIYGMGSFLLRSVHNQPEDLPIQDSIGPTIYMDANDFCHPGVKSWFKGILDENRGRNSFAPGRDKLVDAFMAFRTAYLNTIGCTPYKLVYWEKACHLPFDVRA